MAEYRRFIAYVYEYRNGKKSDNCGFVKVEVRNGLCTVEIHLQVAGLISEEECKVFTFWRKEGLLQGIWIGSCKTEKDMIEGKLETEAQSAGGSGIPLEKMGGMIFITASGGFYGTQWDDQSIRPENFKESTEKREQNQMSKSYGQPEKEEAERQERLNIETLKKIEPEPEPEQQGKLETRPELEQQGKIEPEPEPEQQGKLETRPELEQQGKIELEPEPEQQGKIEPEPEPEQQGKLETRPELEQRGKLESEPELEPQEKSEPEPNSKPEQQKKAGTIANVAQSEKIHIQSAAVSQLNPLSFGQPFCPFTDGDLYQCWKIVPQDLVHFPRRQCSLRNNRFLQYGYYNFGHLLLCRRESGGYILGVPGCYDQQEQFMAGMFGFSCFKESSCIDVKKGRGGYWYRAIDPPVC